MAPSILVTKLFIPTTRPELVPRLRLIEQLNTGLRPNGRFGRKLTLISAPAGFGKTTLVSGWLEKLREGAQDGNRAKTQIAWLSLDVGDNEAGRFLTYFISALDRAVEGQNTFGSDVIKMLQSPQLPPVEAVLTPLINEIAEKPHKIMLVLDDYHLIDAQSIHDLVGFLLDNQPPNLHLVIASREDPLLPLARLRARGQLTELRAAELRFTSEETAEFLNHVMRLELSTEEISALERRTEGWITGLQLAAISMHGSSDAAGFIKSFTGSNRFVLDYLLEEVLEHQDKDIQTFLLKTSILDRMTGPLCDALTELEDGQATLEELEHANLFIISLDNERRWYRYHHLFADLLKQNLGQANPEQLPSLHSRASLWYEQNGFVDEAIEHALFVDDFERASSLIEKRVDAFWRRGDHLKMRQWLSRLPGNIIFANPKLCIYHAWYSFINAEAEVAEKCLQAAEQALGSVVDTKSGTQSQKKNILSSAETAKLRGRLAAIRVYMDSYHGNVPGMLQNASLALEFLPEEDRTWRSSIELALGDVYGFQGDMTAAYKARWEALKASLAAGDVYFVMLTSMKVAITLRAQGRLKQTTDICRQYTGYASDHGLSKTPLNGLQLLIWGEALAELGDLNGAKKQAQEGAELIERSMDMTILGWGTMCLLRILFSNGNLTGVEEIIQKAKDLDRESNVPTWIIKQITSWQARLYILQGKLEEASRWASEIGLSSDKEDKPGQPLTYFLLLEYLVLARIRIAEGQLDGAARLLNHLLTAAETGARTSSVIEIRILQALALQAQKKTDQAVTSLEQALILAEPEGFFRIFVDEGPPMARLLYETLSHGITPDYARRLLAAFPDDGSKKSPGANKSASDSEWIEPLSERELEVLQLIADGMTNRAIADRLYLTTNTVKAHTRSIYGKLDVNSRTQAVARARALGILNSTI